VEPVRKKKKDETTGISISFSNNGVKSKGVNISISFSNSDDEKGENGKIVIAR
jgi:hypothetical protein